MRLRTCSSVSRSRCSSTASVEALGDVDGLEQADLLLERDVGAVAGRVGQRAGIGDGAQERRDALVGAALGEDLLHDRAVLALELAGAPVDGLRVGVLGDLGAQAAVGIGLGRAGDDAASLALQRDAAPAAGQADGVGDLGDRADLGVLPIVPGHEQHALFAGGINRQVDVHRREDDGVVEGNEKKLGHVKVLVSFRCTHNYTEGAYET